jgi:hypothetical protein
VILVIGKPPLVACSLNKSSVSFDFKLVGLDKGYSNYGKAG